MKSDMTGFVIAQQGTDPVEGADDLGEIIAEEVQADFGVQEQAESGLPQLNVADFAPQLVWLVITFVALYLLMARVALPRIATVIESRRDRIAHDLDTAARLKSETDEVIAAYESELAEARGRAHAMAAETREKVNAQLAKERAALDEELAERVSQAERRIGEARNAAMAEVRTVAAEAAADIVDALIGVRPKEAEVNKALDAAERDDARGPATEGA